MRSALSYWILKKWGWKLEGEYPYHLKKGMVIVLHHTTNWDFPIGILLRNAFKVKINFVAKKSLFAFPFGYIFKALGGHPVERGGKLNFVEKVAQIYKEEDYLMLTIAPEGTRDKVDRLKTGFYYIAKAANVPIIMVKFDWKHKIIGWAKPQMPKDTFEETYGEMKKYYKDTGGKFPKGDYIF